MGIFEQILEMILSLQVAKSMVLDGPVCEDTAALANTSALIRQLEEIIDSLTVVADRMREQRDRRPDAPEIPEEPGVPEVLEEPDRPVKAEKLGRRARGRAASARLWTEALIREHEARDLREQEERQRR
eukprot:142863-Heterocapsa_arctica.AAC.1